MGTLYVELCVVRKIRETRKQRSVKVEQEVGTIEISAAERLEVNDGALFSKENPISSIS